MIISTRAVPSEVKQLAEIINANNGRLFIVGGWVRDQFLGRDPKEIDLLILGLELSTGLTLLPNPKQVISNEPVFLIDGGFEVAFGRREISTGKGKGNFEFIAATDVSIEEDLRRRDLTVNAMAMDILTGIVIDPFGGVNDIARGILRHVSDSFVESPERVLRLATDSVRTGFTIDPATIAICQSMVNDFHLIPKEQLRLHFLKAMGMPGNNAGNWFRVMLATGWLVHFPLWGALVNCWQDQANHPCGDAFEHTCHVMDQATTAQMRIAAACHDLGKPITARGDGTFPGHAGQPEIFNAALDVFFDDVDSLWRRQVVELCTRHMDHLSLEGVPLTKRIVRRFVSRLEWVSLADLAELVRCDLSGRPPLPPRTSAVMDQIIAIAADMENHNEMEPLLTGKDLIKMGLKPGPMFGEILRLVENVRFEGLIDDKAGAIEFINRL